MLDKPTKTACEMKEEHVELQNSAWNGFLVEIIREALEALGMKSDVGKVRQRLEGIQLYGNGAPSVAREQYCMSCYHALDKSANTKT